MESWNELIYQKHSSGTKESMPAPSDDLWIAKAGNQPFRYNPRSYTSHHRPAEVWEQTDKFKAALSDDCWGRKPTIGLWPTLLHKSPQEAAHREQTNKFQAAFSDDLWVAEAGNWPFSYDPHSYASHHRKQLIGSKLTNFRQLLVMTCELPRQETNHLVTTHAPTQAIIGSRG